LQRVLEYHQYRKRGTCW